MNADATLAAASVSVAVLALLVTFASLLMSRHAAIRYKNENEQDELLRHDQQRRVFDVILGVPNIAPSLDTRLRRLHDLVHILDNRAARLEINVHDMQKELHPNGGASMRDDVTVTRRLAEEAKLEAKRVADALGRG